MSNYPDAHKISSIIRDATNKKVALTEALVAESAQSEAAEDTIPVMVNGTEYQIKKEAYDAFTEQKSVIKKQMKADLQTASSEFKAAVKAAAKADTRITADTTDGAVSE